MDLEWEHRVWKGEPIGKIHRTGGRVSSRDILLTSHTHRWKSGWEGKPEEEAEEELSEGGGGRKRGGGGGELSGASSQRGDEFVCPRLRLRPGLRNWELGLERHPWKWEAAALGL